jgi:hypothetical protein
MWGLTISLIAMVDLPVFKNKFSSNRPAKPISVQDYQIVRKDRFWRVTDRHGNLVCITVYKCGALEVIRRLSTLEGQLMDNGESAKI